MPKKRPTKARSKRKMRVAFIGAGNRAVSVHYPSIDVLADAEITAVAELDDDRLQSVCDQFSIAGRYTNYEKMIEKEKPDLVYAIMPPHHLYDVAATVIEMGSHLVIEKPPGVTVEQTRQLSRLAQRHQVLTGVTFQRRFAPVIRRGKQVCEAHGKIHSAVASFYKDYQGGAYCRGAIDILTCDAIHAVDTLRYLAGGNVEKVVSDVRALGADYDTAFTAMVTFDSGVTGVLLTNWNAGRRMFTVEIHADGISCFADPEEGGHIFTDGNIEPTERLDPAELSGSHEAYRAFGEYDMNRHFIECVRKKRPMEVSLDDALKTMELVDAVHHSQM